MPAMLLHHSSVRIRCSSSSKLWSPPLQQPRPRCQAHLLIRPLVNGYPIARPARSVRGMHVVRADHSLIV